MKCKVDGCTNTATRKHMCQKHYTRIHKNGTLELLKKGRPKYTTPKLCSLDGCNNLHYAKGLCVNCYMRQHRSIRVKISV